MRDDSRMTLDEYIKFNSMYGSVKQDRPLSKQLLQSIYYSILNDELLIVDDVRDEWIYSLYSNSSYSSYCYL